MNLWAMPIQTWYHVDNWLSEQGEAQEEEDTEIYLRVMYGLEHTVGFEYVVTDEKLFTEFLLRWS